MELLRIYPFLLLSLPLLVMGGMPTSNTDMVFVIQRSVSVGKVNFEEVKDFVRRAVSSWGKHVDKLNPNTVTDVRSTIRLSAVAYSESVHVAFRLDDGYTLANERDFYSALEAIPYTMEAGSDLPGALLAAHDVFQKHSSPSRVQIVAVLSDGQVDINTKLFDDAVQLLHQDYTAVLALAIGNDISMANLVKLTKTEYSAKRQMDPNIHIITDLTFGQLPSAVPLFVAALEDFFDVTCTRLQPMPVCSRLCGMGRAHFVDICDVMFEQDVLIASFAHDCEVNCCIEVCPSSSFTGTVGSAPGGVPRTAISCGNFPPANGSPI